MLNGFGKKAAVLHDLRIPLPGFKANIDHAIVSGKSVLLIDSKMWKPGFYRQCSATAAAGKRHRSSANPRYELYVADPTKCGADFKFAEPYAKAFTATPVEAAAMMRGIYARRGCGTNMGQAARSVLDIRKDCSTCQSSWYEPMTSLAGMMRAGMLVT
ncbi:hypothetical protein BMF89_21285 [Arthrobacter sp. SRS-W-1-2016]|nr:hypothetical protein BMF89_21285 [Arthrobacter sp. SRS-W-1-2016]